MSGVSRSVQLVPIRVYNYEEGSAAGATTSALLKAYDYAIENKESLGIRVVCMSLGVAHPAPFSPDDLLLSKIDEAFAEGIVTVAAAGNNAIEGPYDCYPGDYETVVSAINLQTTSSVGQDGSLLVDDAKEVSRAAGSNRNALGETDKNISAPGTRILSTSTYESYGFGQYQYLSGTSMACPHVAGVLALMFAVSPDLSAQDAVDVLYGSARDIGDEGWDEEFGHGEVDAYGAIRMLLDGKDEPEESRDGWVDLDGGKKGYRKGGQLVTGWMDLDSAKFYFQQDGAMSTGWTDVVVNGTTMHYYFNPASGNMARGTWMDIDGQKYYFRPSGNMATGWTDVNGSKYYLDASGHMLTGWQEMGGKRFYLRPSSIMATGFETIGGTTYLFRSSGTLVQGWADLDGKKYYANADGTIVRGTWLDIDGGHFYFRPSGSMATGWATIDGEMYWFRPSGNMATGWADVDDAYKRYFDENGHMLTGWQQIGGKTYYFRSSGAMQTGKATIDGKVYEFTASGTLKS